MAACGVDQRIAGADIGTKNVFGLTVARQPGKVSNTANVKQDAVFSGLAAQYYVAIQRKRRAFPACGNVLLPEIADG